MKVIGIVIRVLVVLLVAYAAWSLMNPASFIDAMSWVIFGTVLLLSILPDLTARTRLKGTKPIQAISHPMLLIVLSGLAGLALYI